MGERSELTHVRAVFAIVALVIGLVVGGVTGWFTKPKEMVEVPGPTETTTVTTTVTITPTPVFIGFEEAVEGASKGKWRADGWMDGHYEWLREFEGEPFVTPDGLVAGYLEWHGSDGTVYEAEYPSGRVHGEVERFNGVEDTEEYYVWKIISMDGSPCHVDARSGEVLSSLPSRVPNVVAFETAVRIVDAPQRRVEEWMVQEYTRIGDFESEPYETPDGLVKGHLLWRAGNGTLYEVQPPFVRDIRGEVLYIEVPEDTEEYNLWEITTETKIFYIDARNGVIRFIAESPAPTPIPTVSPYLDELRQKPELFRNHTITLYAFFEEEGKVLGNLTGLLKFTRVEYTVYATFNYSLEADPHISNVTFNSGIVWLITQGHYPVPIPFPAGEIYTLQDGESASIEMRKLDDFEPDWVWTQFTAIAIIHNFEVGFDDGRVWRRGEGPEMYDLTYLLNTGQDLLQFLHNNPVEAETLTLKVNL